MKTTNVFKWLALLSVFFVSTFSVYTYAENHVETMPVKVVYKDANKEFCLAVLISLDQAVRGGCTNKKYSDINVREFPGTEEVTLGNLMQAYQWAEYYKSEDLEILNRYMTDRIHALWDRLVGGHIAQRTKCENAAVLKFNKERCQKEFDRKLERMYAPMYFYENHYFSIL